MQRTNFQALMKKYDIHIRGTRPGGDTEDGEEEFTDS